MIILSKPPQQLSQVLNLQWKYKHYYNYKYNNHDYPQSLYVQNNFGFMPSLSLKNNEIVSIFKGHSDGNLVCGTPYFGDLPQTL